MGIVYRWLIQCKGEQSCILLKSPYGDFIEHSFHFGFLASNIEAKYKALIAARGLAKKFRATLLKIASDSQLVINQVNDTYAAKCPTMVKYSKKV